MIRPPTRHQDRLRDRSDRRKSILLIDCRLLERASATKVGLADTGSHTGVCSETTTRLLAQRIFDLELLVGQLLAAIARCSFGHGHGGEANTGHTDRPTSADSHEDVHLDFLRHRPGGAIAAVVRGVCGQHHIGDAGQGDEGERV